MMHLFSQINDFVDMDHPQRISSIVIKRREIFVCGSSVSAILLTLFAALSCEMVHYPDGTLGLYTYSSNQQPSLECTSYDYSGDADAEDPALQSARLAAGWAVASGVALLSVYGIYMRQLKSGSKNGITKSNRFSLFVLQHLFESCATAVQVSLMVVYAVWNNTMCDTFGCTRGWGSTYLLLSQIMFLVTAYVAYGCMVQIPHGTKSQSSEEQKK